MRPFDQTDPRLRQNGLVRMFVIAVRRDRQLAARLVAAAFGAALLFSPWAFGIVGNAATWTAWALGFLLVSLGVVTAAEAVRWPDRVLLAVGTIVVAAPWAMGFSADRIAVACHVAVGVGVIATVAAQLSKLDRAGFPVLRRRPFVRSVQP
jgi:hypothetical protein